MSDNEQRSGPKRLAAAICLAFASAPAAAESIAGQWVAQNRKAVIGIEPCGRRMCGRIVRLLPASDVGKTVDERNSDARLRGRPLLGLPILLDLEESESGWRGKLYDPQAGDTYTTVVGRYPDGALKVKGCFFFICKTQKWIAAR